MQSIKTIFFLIVITLGFNACYYDVEQELYPQSGTCDTSANKLAAHIKPILQKSCYACHSQSTAGSAGAGINLETYANLKAQADNGKLLKSIQHDPSASPMPKGSSSKMDACEILKIQAWIQKGALNN